MFYSIIKVKSEVLILTHESGCHFFSLNFMSDLILSRKKPLLLIIDLYKTEDEYRF